MRPPSRHILPRRTVSARGVWVFGCLAVLALLCLAWLAPLPILLGVLAVIVLGTVGGHFALRQRRMQLLHIAAARPADSICQFARSFDTAVVDTWVIRAVYDSLQQELEYAHPAFPVRASDALHELLFDHDDLDMALAPEIARRCGRTLDASSTNPYYDRVHTVRDLVLFFNAQGRTPGFALQPVPANKF